MSIFGVGQGKERALQDKMRRYGIAESDIKEKFIRPSGKGGRKADKTSNTVYLKHIPTGLEVKCAQTRSQALNRFLARRILAEKIEDLVEGERSERRKRIEKIRRQKRRRSKRAKEKALRNKRMLSEKKKMRKKVKWENHNKF